MILVCCCACLSLVSAAGERFVAALFSPSATSSILFYARLPILRWHVSFIMWLCLQSQIAYVALFAIRVIAHHSGVCVRMLRIYVESFSGIPKIWAPFTDKLAVRRHVKPAPQYEQTYKHWQSTHNCVKQI